MRFFVVVVVFLFYKLKLNFTSEKCMVASNFLFVYQHHFLRSSFLAIVLNREKIQHLIRQSISDHAKMRRMYAHKQKESPSLIINEHKWAQTLFTLGPTYYALRWMNFIFSLLRVTNLVWCPVGFSFQPFVVKSVNCNFWTIFARKRANHI